MKTIVNSTGYPQYLASISHCEGCYVYDEDQQRYLDLESGVWALPLGHQHPRITTALVQQAAIVQHTGYKYTHAVVNQAAEKLAAITGIKNGGCVFLSSGSEAVEFSLRAAGALNHQRIVCLEGQYLSAYGMARQDADGWLVLPWLNQEERTIQQWQAYIAKTIPVEEVGIFIFDPGNTSGTAICPPKNLIAALAATIQAADGLVIVDEVTTGIGRTGKWFGYMHYDVLPDIIAVGKGLGNGYPVSGVVMRRDVAKRLEATDFMYAQSHQNDPLGCRVALEVLTVIEEEQLLKQSNAAGSYFVQQAQEALKRCTVIDEIRSRGLLTAIQFQQTVTADWMMQLDQRLFSKGIIAGVKPQAAVLRVYMPLIVTTEMMDTFLAALAECLLEMA